MATNADTRISQLGKANTLTGAELVPMTQNINGVLTTVQATTQQIQQQLGVSSLNPVFTGTATIPNATGTGTWVNSGVTILSGTATDTFSSPLLISGTATDTWAAPLSVTGPFVVPNGQTGRTSAVPAGSVGERIESVFTGVSMTSAALTNLTSISLTAGVWDVTAVGDINTSTLTAVTAGASGVSTTSVTLPVAGRYQQFQYGTPTGSGIAAPIVAPSQRLVLTTTTTVYYVARATISSGTLTAEGTMVAIRAA